MDISEEDFECPLTQADGKESQGEIALYSIIHSQPLSFLFWDGNSGHIVERRWAASSFARGNGLKGKCK